MPSPVLMVALLSLPAAGCLFIEDINEAPVARLDVVAGGGLVASPILLSRRCHEPLRCDASRSFDPNRQPLGWEWRVDGAPAASIPSRLDFVIRGSLDRADVTFHTAGEHTVEVVALDSRRAASAPARVVVQVADAPPRATILLADDSGCGDFAIGRLPLAAKEDDDADVDCGETITYHWRVAPPPGSRAQLLRGDCDVAVPPGGLDLAADAQGSRACLVADVQGDYQLTLEVDDGASRPLEARLGNGQLEQRVLRVGPDRPPCMDGFAPPPGGRYLFDRGLPQRLEITEVRDDRDPFPDRGLPSQLSFRWSIWQERNPSWREVPGYRLPYLDLDPRLFAVDELVRVRAQAIDRSGVTTTACDATVSLCSYAAAYPKVKSCFMDARCQAWATWEMRFR